MRKAATREDTYAKNREKDCKSAVSRLYRSSVQLAQRLDIILKSTSDWQELFLAETIGIRQRLRGNCESLIFSHPKEYGRKAEELLWRKVFYDVIQCLRQQRKGSNGDIYLDSSCRSHLLSASGYYYHLLLRLQTHYAVNIEGVVSWTAQYCTASKQVDLDKEVEDWALRACQRCLLYLGDLARYQQEFEGEKSLKLAERFYCEAFHLNPDLGMPHNQLGTLLGTQIYGCEGVYHYMRCLIAKESFEGTEGNLLRLFEKNRGIVMGMKELPLDASSTERVRRFLIYFIYLQDALYGHESSPKVTGDEIGQLCQSVLQDLSFALAGVPNPTTDGTPQATSSPTLMNGDLENGTTKDQLKSGEIELTGALMVKLVAVVIMTVTRLKAEGSPQASVATAFSLAFLSQLLQQCISSLEQSNKGDDKSTKTNTYSPLKLTNGKKTESISNTVDDEHEKLVKARRLKKLIKTRRRRRKHRNTSSSLDSCVASDSDNGGTPSGDDESDLSEGGADVDDLNDVDSDDSDDVYVESESGDDSADNSPATMFSRRVTKESGKEPWNGSSLNEAGKLLSQQIMKDHHLPFMKQNGVVFGKVTKIETSDVSDVETECSTSSWGRIEDLEEFAVVRRLFNAKLLSAVKVMTDWLCINPDIISTCVESSSSLWSKMASLLNILPSVEHLKNTGARSYLWREVVGQVIDEHWSQTLALPEDVCLLGLAPLRDAHTRVDMRWIRPPREGRCLEAIIRTQCMRNFGLKLSRNEALSTFLWDESNQQFLGPNQLAEKEKKANELNKSQIDNLHEKGKKLKHKELGKEAVSQRSKVMKAMAHRRMQSEVTKLEKTLKSAPKGTTAYLVLDAPALCSQLHLVRRLLTSEKFLLIIPIQVIAALDELKKYDNGARETIKYLEAEFKRGNRWIRAQKDGESVESNKRRGRYEDVAVWRFNQVVNCCRFLVNQTGKGLVTLLTGSSTYESPPKNQRKRSSGTQATPETVEFARSCGVGVESLRAFCAKYTSTRSVT